MEDMPEIVMKHPAKNALSSDLVAWLDAQLDAHAEEPLLLTGSGGAFSAGLHLREVASLEPPAMERFLGRVDRLVTRLWEWPAPTVALVEGHAIAGGCVLLEACDHRVAADDAAIKIGLNEVALGVCFPPAILEMLQRRLPPQQRERVLLGAGLFAPREALAIGLLDEVAADAPAAARRALDALARHPRQAYARTKATVRGRLTLSAAVERRFREQELPLWTSPEVRARLLAALSR
jgi:enoyl-CoA hydratase/carnithine racemase